MDLSRAVGTVTYQSGGVTYRREYFTSYPDQVKTYLDNLRLPHADGTATRIWTGGKDTRYRPIADSDFFTGIRVRSVPADQVK